MRVFIDEFYYENIENRGGHAAIGTFDRHYRSSRNFIANLKHVGPILVSVARDGAVTRVLVRSVLGFREYRFSNRHIPGCPWFFGIRNSLARYFNDTVDGWSYSEANAANKRLSSIMGIFSSMFSFGSSWPLTNAVESVRRGMYSAITAQMMESPDAFLLRKILGKLAEIGPEHAGEPDREFHRAPIYVNVVVDAVERIPLGLLGKKIILADEDCNVSAEEVACLAVSFRETKSLQSALLGFVFNEVEYFNQLNSFHHDVVLRSGCDESIFEALFREFVDVYEFEAGFLRLMESVIGNMDIDMEALVRDPQYFRVHAKSVDGLMEEDEDILGTIVSAFNSHLTGLECYGRLMLRHEDSLDALEKYKAYGVEGLPGEKEMRECFCNCLQRIVRYPLLVNDILRNMDESSVYLDDMKAIYLRIVKLICIVDKRKEGHDNLRSTQIIQEKVLQLPAHVLGGEMAFLAQLNCEDVYGEPKTLFLLSSMLVVADRRGPPVSILDPNSRKYVSQEVFKLGQIDICVFGKSGLKITMLSAEEGMCEMEEMHGDVSIGVQYFLGCSSSSRAEFVQIFHRTRIPTSDVFVSFGNVFFRLVGSAACVDEGSDMAIYTCLEDFEASGHQFAGLLDLDRFTFRLRSDGDVVYEHRRMHDGQRFREQFAETVVNAVQLRRAMQASQSTPRDAPQTFARFRVSLREIVEKHGDAAMARFDERLSRVDEVSLSLKINRAKALVEYMNRSLSYIEEDSSIVQCLDDDAGKARENMQQLCISVLESREIEDSMLDEYELEIVLDLLMYLIRTNIYVFFDLDDISAMHRVLFGEKTLCLQQVLAGVGSSAAPFISSLLDLVVVSRSRMYISSAMATFAEIFACFDVSRQDVLDAMARIHWQQ